MEKENNCGIYKITNKINRKIYIGQSTNIQSRWSAHRTRPFQQKDKRYHSALYVDIRIYGIDNFMFEIVEFCNENDLDEREEFYITQYMASGALLYNLNIGKHNGAAFRKLSDEDVKAIICELKNTMNDFADIGKKYNVGGTTIKSINRGMTYKQNDECYPIRPNLNKLITKHDGGYELKQTIKHCALCGAIVQKNASMCVACAHIAQRKVQNRPTKSELIEMILTKGFEQTGRDFGVSGNTIKKWCKSYNVPYHKKELASWLQQGDFKNQMYQSL